MKTYISIYIVLSVLFSGLLLSGAPAHAQNSVSLPMLASPSPTATMMNRFGNYPVSLYTGTVDVTIPIHEINVGGIKVPISFRYHTSGLKYDDVPMEVGYGWALMAGGTVSLTFRGTPEGRSFSGSGNPTQDYDWVKEVHSIGRYLSTAPGISTNDQRRLMFIQKGMQYPYLYDHIDEYADSEYDVYDYNFLHHSGKMYVRNTESIVVPANGLKVTTLGGVKEIVDHEGINYRFTVMDYDNYGFNEVAYLTRIISANKADTVTFNYTTLSPNDYNTVSKPVIDQYFQYKHIVYPSGVFNDEFLTPGGKGLKFYCPPRLSSITYRGGRVDFTYTATTGRNLSEVVVKDGAGLTFRKVKLVKSNTNWLSGVEFRDNSNTLHQSYGFEYNGIPSAAPGMDYWGYYNGKSSTHGGSYMPKLTFQIYGMGSSYSYTIPGLDRTPNESEMQGGILKKIIYPTKGYTLFEYEAHRADNLMYGGLRIKTINNYNHDGSLQERKYYRYGVNESGNGRAVTPLPYTDPVNILSPFRREAFVMENAYDTQNHKFYYTYYYPFPLLSYYASGSTVVYSEVTEYQGTGSTPEGKTVYRYTDTPDEKRSTFRGMSQPQKYKDYHWKNGLLTSKEVYKQGSSQAIYSLTNEYDCDESYSEELNLRVTEYADIIDVIDHIGEYGPPFSAEEIKHGLQRPGSAFFADLIAGTLFDYSNYYITTGMPVLTSSSEYRDGAMTFTDYSAYNNIGLPREVWVTNSNGDVFKTQYKYPADLGTAPYGAMAAYGILSPVIQEERYKGNTLLSKSVNEYKDWGVGRFDPEILKLKPSSAANLEDRITYHKRDPRGNPRHISKDGAEQVVYIWGYNAQYPIAEIRGVTLSQVTSYISEASMNTIAERYEPSANDWTSINALRSQLPGAQVTTYTYKPLCGVLTVTAPNQAVTYYDYDTFGRLKEIYVKEGSAKRTLQSFTYNYKN